MHRLGLQYGVSLSARGLEAEFVADRQMDHDGDRVAGLDRRGHDSGEPHATIPSTKQAGAARRARASSAWVVASPSGQGPASLCSWTSMPSARNSVTRARL